MCRPRQFSKTLAYILRHGARVEGIKVRPDGYVRVLDLVQHRLFKHTTVEALIKLVRTDSKQRYCIGVASLSSQTTPQCSNKILKSSTMPAGAPTSNSPRDSPAYESFHTMSPRRESSHIEGRTEDDLWPSLGCHHDGVGHKKCSSPCQSLYGPLLSEYEVTTSLEVAGRFNDFSPIAVLTSALGCEDDEIEIEDLNPNAYILNDEMIPRLYIRAFQGHSIPCINPKLLYKRVLSSSEIPVCVHGTFWSNWNLVMTEGLRRMSRLHIHFARGLPGDDYIVSGIRSKAEVAIFVDVELAMSHNIVFWLSGNNVILTEGINGLLPKIYFSRAVSLPERSDIPLNPDYCYYKPKPS